MNYKKILRQIAIKENTSVKEIEREMTAAIRAAGLTCSVKHFIENAAESVKQKTIYSNIV